MRTIYSTLVSKRAAHARAHAGTHVQADQSMPSMNMAVLDSSSMCSNSYQAIQLRSRMSNQQSVPIALNLRRDAHVLSLDRFL